MLCCLQGDVPEGQRHTAVREVAIHISNHTMRREDRGVVVVGGSMELGDLAHQGASGLPDLALSPTRVICGQSGRCS